ncbi:MAG: transketolase [Cyanobacteria bacterium]|nr:transketolase [Cyanobacteriota bacterium]
MDKEKKEMLQKKATDIRVDIIEMLCEAGSGHSGGSLSIADVFAYLYFSGDLKLDPKNPLMKDRDRIVLSKGHACPVLYAALIEKGYIDRSNLKTLRKFGSILQGHPDMKKVPGVEMSTGSLGQGLSAGVGMALGLRLDNYPSNVFVIIGDGEIEEGQIWEAAMAAANYKLGNLIGILDKNGLQIDGFTKDIMNSEPLTDKWRAFGWEVFEINGHNFDEIEDAIKKAKEIKDKPVMIIAHTVKGKGVSFMENQCGWHGKAPSPEERDKALSELTAGTVR